MTVHDRLIAALKEQFPKTQDVAFVDHVPTTFTPPQVAVAPGDPFLEPATHGRVRERWNVMVVVNSTGPDRGVGQMRRTALKVVSAAHSVGGVWTSCRVPTRLLIEGSSYVYTDVLISFIHNPNDLTQEESK